MRYFKLRFSTEPSIVGEYPQCNPKKDVDPEGTNGYRLVRWNSFPDFLPHVELELNPKARWTDFLSSVGPNHGFIISSDLKQIIEQYELPSRAFYPIKVHSKMETKDYFWFHFINNEFWDWVDKKETKLYLRSILPDERDKIIEEANLDNDLEGFMEMARSKPSLTNYYWERLVFNNDFPNLDFFTTLFPSMHSIVSQRLINAFESAGITGYETKDFSVHE
ncbi:hypothetical protein [Spongiimicrobium sp. 3-5]|uniref:hypothetical protein n=1 Tax=Spongiimicrobium sp. 3-5 TaxID=3332596 RepID=UPI00397F2B42